TVDTVDTKKKGVTVKVKLKIKLGQKKTVKTNFNANLLSEKGLVNAKAKVQVGDLANVKAGAKVLADDGTLVGAKAKIGVGGKSGLKAGVGATVGTNGIGANVSV